MLYITNYHTLSFTSPKATIKSKDAAIASTQQIKWVDVFCGRMVRVYLSKRKSIYGILLYRNQGWLVFAVMKKNILPRRQIMLIKYESIVAFGVRQ